ncbi:MAG: S-layer homology domain-containing protein [Bacillota bacterium]|nr:S-layer homology domain-containing protein [Bacillota bacterium]
MEKKISGLFLIMISLFVISGVTFASNEATTLYKLKLLAGDGTGFNLEGQLKRSDAAAFIVKYMGENENVREYSFLYDNTNFSDVDKNEWYAKYIGYLVKQGVIEGYGDGTFKPNELVSEKAFLKMALVGLGYEYNKDFDWSDIYIKAYEVGLVEDMNYVVKIDDDYNYTRGSVVNVIYSALDKQIKNQNKTIVERLIDEKVTSYSIVNSLGLIRADDKKTAIDSISVLSLSNIKIKLNEKISSYKLEIVDSKGNILVINDRVLNDDELNITTEIQEESEKYIVKLTEVKDNDNFIIPSLEKEFTSLKEDVIESVFFEISKIDVLSNREIEVVFTHPINDLAKQVLLYSIKQNNIEIIEGNYKTINVSVDTSSDNSIKIWLLEDKLEDEQQYVLDINAELKSEYTVHLNKGEGQEFEFVGKGNEPSELKLQKIEVLNDDYLRLTFNKALDEDSALDNNNYSMDDNDSSTGDYNQASNVKFTGTGDLLKRQIDVKFLNMKKNHQYELELDDIKDIYEYDEINNYEENFLCDYSSDSIEPTVKFEFAVAINEKMIDLYFDEPIDELSKNAYITISGESIIKKVLDKDKPYILTLILSSRFTENEEEDIKIISGIYDLNGNRVTEQMIQKNIKGSNNKINDVKIAKIDFISEEKIKVEFDRSINTSASDNKNDYILKYEDEENDNYKLEAKEVNFISDKVLILSFETLENTKEYELIITDLIDVTTYKTEEIMEDVHMIE